ncbi:MAG: Mrp/NBP35 family ATP-binding protein [Bacilli bacterium]|nr:Mrp/NBP35 family ATP-binding protein [Bacilli bacterium]
MAECNHDCENCASAEGCPSKIEKAKLNDRSHIKRIVAVLSGKGGVGKSFITSTLAVYLNRQGYKVGILDADITGPSIPKAFGIKDKAYGEDSLIYPLVSNGGIKVISANCLLEDESDPIVWRGVLLGNLIKQFYEDVLWEELDYLLIDMPPGTGDVALSVFQLLPVDDLVIVTSPQDLVKLIVTKAIKMANMMNINVLGVVENMSYYQCPDCGKKIEIFGPSKVEEFSKELNFDILAKLPLNSENTALMDKGDIEMISLQEIAPAVEAIIERSK